MRLSQKRRSTRGQSNCFGRLENSKKNFLSPRAHVLFSIYLIWTQPLKLLSTSTTFIPAVEFQLKNFSFNFMTMVATSVKLAYQKLTYTRILFYKANRFQRWTNIQSDLPCVRQLRNYSVKNASPFNPNEMCITYTLYLRAYLACLDPESRKKPVFM